MRPAKTERLCVVCRGLEPTNLNRMLLLGWSPRFLSARWGHSRGAIKRHAAQCLSGELRDGTERDLYAMAARAAQAREGEA